MNTVAFRDFEERDIDFIYRCKNDENLNSMIVGEFKPKETTPEELGLYMSGAKRDNGKEAN